MKAISRGRIGHSVGMEFVALTKSIFSRINDKSKVNKFESEFASLVGHKHCIAFPLARTGLYAILKSLDLPKGTKIITPTISIKGILDVILDLGFEPVFLDISLIDFSWSPTELQFLAKSKPKVAILTYLFGLVPDLDKIISVLKKSDIYIIEDFSQAWGAEYKGKKLGSIGDASIYSTSSIKSIDTFGGGMVLVSDNILASKLRLFENKLDNTPRSYLFKKILASLVKNLATSTKVFNLFLFPIIKLSIKIGMKRFDRFVGNRNQQPIKSLPREWFYKYTSTQAQIGLVLLQQSILRDEKRISIASKFLNEFSENKSLNRIIQPKKSVYWQFIMIVDDFNKFRSHLHESKIDTGLTSLINLSELPAYSISNRFKNADLFYTNGAYIPCYAELSSNEVERIIRSVNSYSKFF